MPRIAIPVPTSGDPEYNRRSWPQYAHAVSLAGGEPVRLAIEQPGQIHGLLFDMQGFLLPGSPADLRPSRYGVAPDPQTAAADMLREVCDDLLIEHAVQQGKPLLGICFGLQSLNVWHGGSLVQDLLPLPVNHSAGKEVAIAHTVLIAPGSLLGDLLAGSEALEEPGYLRLPVNTSHHQAVARPGQGLRVVARCPDDGVIEALEGEAVQEGPPAPFLLGVQWHPERSVEISAASRALFGRFVSEAGWFAGAHGVK